jgi:curved DNA-binding protein CbpA
MSPKPAGKAPRPSDPYMTLGIDRRASDAEIKRAYFKLVREYSPEHAPEKFQEIRAAYERLRTPEARSQADLFLIQPPPAMPRRRIPKLDLNVHEADIIALAFELSLAETSVHKDFHEPILPTH